jgi:hypothetical protein
MLFSFPQGWYSTRLTANGDRVMMGGIRKDLPSKEMPVPKVQTADSPRPLKRLRKTQQRIARINERLAANNKPA